VGGGRAPGHRGVRGHSDYYVRLGQTDPPTREVRTLFPGEHFPHGEESAHPSKAKAEAEAAVDLSTTRTTGEEARYLERLHSDLYESMREAAEVHRQVRAYAHSIIKPGLRLADMCESIENMVRRLVGEDGPRRGMGFPTGCSLNHVAAHYTPNPGDATVLSYEDVMKVDFGVQINGRIIDCAFSVAFDPKYDPLLEAVKAATNTGLRAAGIDARLGEIGAAIQETMESHEIELGGKVFPIKCIRNLNGHSIMPYQVRGGGGARVRVCPSVRPSATEASQGSVQV
jgi:methionyl aminopeptidase